MPAPDRQRVKAVFAQISEAPNEQREALLAELCDGDATLADQVRRLLTADDRAGDGTENGSGFLAEPAIAGAAELARQAMTTAPEPVGDVGAYTIIHRIGEGGMGAVYEATQKSPNRSVALKLIHAGSATAALKRRLRHEAHILGRLEHPGIARVYEAGSAPVTYTDGAAATVPFIAMELIRGQTLAKHAEAMQLSTAERLQLLATIADAVQYAHQNGVIHRDLKPGNILVSKEGDPKILDFGVARLTDPEQANAVTIQQTMQGQIIGTLAYMSPEQIAGDLHRIDTRTDVYALGVIAYELLSGKPPLELGSTSLAQAARIITEVEPKSLAVAAPKLKGDVATIIDTALAKDADQRYQTAAAFAQDIRHHLRNEPISVRPPSSVYLLKKFAARNKAIVGAAAVVAIVLVLGIIATSVLAVRANNARRLAEREALRSQTSAEFMRQMLGGVSPAVARGSDTALLKKILDQTAERLDNGELASEPVVEAELRNTIGRTYKAISSFDASISMLERSAELFGETEPVRAHQSRQDLSAVLIQTGRYEQAESLLFQIRDEAAAFGSEVEIVEADATLGALYNQWGRFDLAVEPLERSLAGRQRLYGADSTSAIASMSSLAGTYSETNRLDEAIELYELVADYTEQRAGADHPNTALALNNLAAAYTRNGDTGAALLIIDRAISIQRATLGDSHTSLGMSLYTKASLMLESGDGAEARMIFSESLKIFEDSLPGSHWFIAQTHVSIGKCMASEGDFEQASVIMRSSYDQLKDSLGPDNVRTQGIAEQIAELFQQWNESEPSDEIAAEAARWRRATNQKH